MVIRAHVSGEKPMMIMMIMMIDGYDDDDSDVRPIFCCK